jgi:hypothetical protein
MISLPTLLSPVTAAQARTTAVNQLVSYGIPANNWRQGGVFSTLLTVFCTLYAGLFSLVSQAINSMFLGTASGQWLTALAYYVYGITAQKATFGTTPYTLTNTGGGIYSFAPGQFVCQCGINGNSFTNVSTFSLAAGTPATPTTATFDVVAQVAGTAGGAPANTIATLITVMVSVTGNNSAACLGLDADSDAKIVSKCYAALAARSQKGPAGAYLAAIYGYSNVPGATNSVTGQPVNINRTQVYTDPDTGNISVYLASPAGVPDVNDIVGVQTAIDAIARPMGVVATAMACTPVYASGTITLWSDSVGAKAAQDVEIIAYVELLSAFSTYPIGGLTKPPGTQGYLWASYVEGVAMQADPSIYAVDLPIVNLPLAPGAAAVFTGNILVRQVSQ